MKTLTCLALILLFCFANADRVPAEWKARYAAEKKLVVARDLAGYKALVSDDYVYVLADGKKLNKKQTFVEIEQMFKAKKITMDETLTSVVKHGNIYDVSFDAKLTMEFAGSGTMHYHEIGIDSWKKIHGKWLIVRTVDKVADQTGPK